MRSRSNGRRKRREACVGGKSAPWFLEARPFRVTVHQQHRELVGGERMERRTCRLRPPREMTFRESLEAQPEALSVVNQQFKCSRAPVAKQKDGAGERVTVKTIAAERGKGINAFAEIHWLIGEHDL